MQQGMSQGGSSTGTRDETYDLVAVVYHALQGAENCQTYSQDAQGKDELRQFFDRACEVQKQLADEGKRLLHDQLMHGSSGGSSQGSAFSQFGSSEGSSSGMSGSQQGKSGGDQQGMSGSMQDRQGGSAYTSGESVSAQGDDQSMGQFGQSPMGGGQRHNEMTTGGGGTSTF